MNKLSLAILLSLAGLAGIANAQSGITESTDPAKIAAIEQRARELGRVQPAAEGAKPMADAMSMHEMHHGKKHHGKKHHGKKHHGMKHHGARHHGMMPPPAKGELAVPGTPAAPVKP